MTIRFIRPLFVATLAGAGVAVACPPVECTQAAARAPDRAGRHHRADRRRQGDPSRRDARLVSRHDRRRRRPRRVGDDEQHRSQRRRSQGGDLLDRQGHDRQGRQREPQREHRDESVAERQGSAAGPHPAASGNTLEILDDSGNVTRSIELPHVSTAGSHGGIARTFAKARSGARAGARAHVIAPGVPFGPAGRPGEAPKVMLGITMDQPDETLAEQLHVDAEEVTVLLNVNEDTPAAKAGLQKHDIVVAIDGKSPASPQAIREALKDKEPGESVTMSVISGGKTKEVTVKLEAFDPRKLGGARARRRLHDLRRARSSGHAHGRPHEGHHAPAPRAPSAAQR